MRIWGQRAQAVIALALALLLTGGHAASATDLLGPTTTYIVSVDGDFNDLVKSQLTSAGIAIEDEFEYAADAFVVQVNAAQLSYIQSLQYVKSVEADSPVYMQAVQTATPSWGLDRIDQRGPTNYTTPGDYQYESAGRGATIYIGDTGVLNHVDLEGRISSSGYTTFSDGWGTRDCNGH